MGARG
ncbi:microtubule associated monoxygenase, calponin and LIM domain containing 1 (predicted), isoform CRA_b [Rattus norvegicus]